MGLIIRKTDRGQDEVFFRKGINSDVLISKTVTNQSYFIEFTGAEDETKLFHLVNKIVQSLSQNGGVLIVRLSPYFETEIFNDYLNSEKPQFIKENDRFYLMLSVSEPWNKALESYWYGGISLEIYILPENIDVKALSDTEIILYDSAYIVWNVFDGDIAHAVAIREPDRLSGLLTSISEAYKDS